MMLSISSKKTVEGACHRARSNSTRTSFSESPLYLETIDDAEMLKNVVFVCVATALANKVLPVPGGPNNKTPPQDAVSPRNSCGYRAGMTTASLNKLLAE